MGESTAPFGKNEKRQSANEKIFELTTVSPAYFFIHTLPLLVLLKVGVFGRCGNNGIGGALYAIMTIINSFKGASFL